VGLLGPNGAGKTTSFYMIVGLIKPNEGKIFLDDVDITGDPMYRRAQKGIGYLARKHLYSGSFLLKIILRQFWRWAPCLKTAKGKLEELIDEFSLHKVRRNRGDLLSGGERRRTEIARALAAEPNFICLMNPSPGLTLLRRRDPGDGGQTENPQYRDPEYRP